MGSSPTSTASRRAPRADAKRRAILAGAKLVFAEVGYERACVDVIAARAGVSKATVYSHFTDKSTLYLATFSDETDTMRTGFVACIGEAAPSVERDLQRIGEKLMALTLSPAIVALYRHTSTECARFPAMGQLLYDRGAGVVYPALAAHLRRWEASGALRLDDARAAAIQFAMLCQGDLYFRAQIGILTYPADALIRETVKRAVRVFLRAYAPAAPAERRVTKAVKRPRRNVRRKP